MQDPQVAVAKQCYWQMALKSLPESIYLCLMEHIGYLFPQTVIMKFTSKTQQLLLRIGYYYQELPITQVQQQLQENLQTCNLTHQLQH